MKINRAVKSMKVNAVNLDSGTFITWMGIAQICSWGTLYYSFPQLAAAIEAELGWQKSSLYGALTLGFLLTALAGIPVGRWIDKGHGRNVMTLGSSLAGLVMICGSQIQSILGFYLVFASIGLLQATCLYDAAFSVIARHSGKALTQKRITALTLWGGFASTAFIPFIELLLSWGSWRDVFVVLGIINILVCAGIYSRLPQNKGGVDHRSGNTGGGECTPKGVKWAISQPIFWTLILCFALFATLTSAFQFHLYPMLVEKGLSTQEVVMILAIFGPAQVTGRILMWMFGSRVTIANLGLVTVSVIPIVFLAINYLPMSFWMLVPCAIVFGAANGTMTIVKGIAVPELVTRQAYGAINGAMNMPIKVIKAFAPTLAALVWNMAGGYALMMDLLIGLGVIVVVSFYMATRIKTRTSPLVV